MDSFGGRMGERDIGYDREASAPWAGVQQLDHVPGASHQQQQLLSIHDPAAGMNQSQGAAIPMQPMGFPSQDWGTSQDFVGTQSPLGTAMPFLQQPKIHGLPVPPSMPRLSAPRPRSASGKEVKYDNEFITNVAMAYEQLKMDPQRDVKCGDKNPAQVIGARFKISEWTVYRHYKRAISDGLIMPADAKARNKNKVAATDNFRRGQRATADANGGTGSSPVSVHNLQGDELDGFSFYCQYNTKERCYNMWCKLPGVECSEDLQVRCQSDGNLLLMINPKHLAGQPAPMLGEEEIASFSESYGFAAEDLRQPYHVKKVVSLPLLIDPSTAHALVTPEGKFYISVHVAGAAEANAGTAGG